MSEFLKAANWTTVLSKPKNVGLKMQGLGVTKALGLVEAAEGAYKLHFGKDDPSKYAVALKNLRGALQAVQSLAGKEAQKHPFFPEAMDYLRKVGSAANLRYVKLADDEQTFKKKLKK